MGFPGGSDGKESACQCRGHGFDPCVWEDSPGLHFSQKLMLSAFPFSLSIGFPACHPYGPQINKPISPISGWSPLLSELLKDFSTLDHFL